MSAQPRRTGRCAAPPPGWRCTREPGHDGPCAAVDSSALPEPTRTDVELLGFSVLVAVFERLTPEERRRALTYLADRYNTRPSPSASRGGGVPVPPPTSP